jgi:DNA helicase-2/ATP-dependent DNA helicase PcrA
MNAFAEPIDRAADLGFLDRLNARQRAAAEHGAGEERPGPLLVIAGAGSGKTSTLAHRVAALTPNLKTYGT